MSLLSSPSFSDFPKKCIEKIIIILVIQQTSEELENISGDFAKVAMIYDTFSDFWRETWEIEEIRHLYIDRSKFQN